MTGVSREFWRGRRVLVTGGGGFLGAWLARLLVDPGAEVANFDLAPGVCLAVHGLADRVAFLRGSVMDQDAIEQALRAHRADVCFHLAGQSMIEGAAAGPIAALDVNVRGTWLVLEACRRVGTLRAIVCASSNHTYGPQQASPFTEDQPMNQLDVYGASKACADILARAFAKNFDMPVVAARNVNSFGPGDPHTTHVVTGSILALLRGEAPVIRSDGSPIKAYLHARDTMSAYARLAEHASQAGVRGEAFNVTPAEPIRVDALVRLVIKVAGKTGVEPVIARTDLSQKGFFEHLSDAKMRRVLGWTPSFSLEEGLADTYRWYAEHGTGWTRHHA
ncbi:MAG: NAD(P)-dependent oxidoreductase [Candidatus Rokubacteria bacterium]|nr:NAD(P)-dependent oxidoreductase [Candidatus Rokubacteria bacterium]